MRLKANVAFYRDTLLLFGDVSSLFPSWDCSFLSEHYPKQTANVVNFFWRRLFAFCSRWTQFGHLHKLISASRINYDLVFAIMCLVLTYKMYLILLVDN